MTSAGEIRRALIAFDVAGSVPAGSTIQAVTLSLNMSMTIAGPQAVSLHRVAADWGEGTSNASPFEGAGAPSTAGDATWIHRFFNTVFWGAAGGDFDPTSSATTIVDQAGPHSWGPTNAMVADVQSWLDSPSSSFGWILIGNEAGLTTAKRFDSRQHVTAGLRPRLTVEFLASAPAGSVPDGGSVPGTPLRVQLAAGGDVLLSWDPSCLATDTDYAIYEGVLGDFTSHAPRFCSTGGATNVSFPPAAASSYYLVVPRNAAREGSYGLRSDASERPASVSGCVPQAIAACR